MTSVLLYGPPGTGKTHLAKALASVTKATLFIVKPSDVLHKYLGESEKFISCLFDMARARKPALLFLDECDAFMGHRQSSDDSNIITVKNTLLMEMDGVKDPVPVLATTNRRDELDPAFQRRLGRHIFVDVPDEEARRTIVNHYLHEKLTDHETAQVDVSEIDANQLVEICDGKSAADIVLMFRLAASKALDEMKEVDDKIHLKYRQEMFTSDL